MFRNIICVIIIFLSSTAFRIAGLGKGDRVMELLGIGIILILLVFHIVYQEKTDFKMHYRNHFLILLFSGLLSCFMADLVHKQSYVITLYQSRAVLFYLFYFLLHYLRPDSRYLEKAIVSYGLIYCVLYIVQTIVYPTLITEARVFIDRGTLRIFMPGGVIMLLGYFIAFDKIFQEFKWLYLIFLLFSLIVAFLLGTRQILFSLLVLSFVNILINKKIKSRVALLFLFIGVVSISAFIMRDTINEMIELTYKHSSEKEGYIRVRAAEYFLTEFHDNTYADIFGNGEPTERSSYGVSMAKISNTFGFYLSDVGLIAVYFKFGLLFAITCLVLIINAISRKISQEIVYIKYYFFLIIFTLVTSQIPFELSEGIVVISIIFYIIDADLNNQEKFSVIK